MKKTLALAIAMLSLLLLFTGCGKSSSGDLAASGAVSATFVPATPEPTAEPAAATPTAGPTAPAAATPTARPTATAAPTNSPAAAGGSSNNSGSASSATQAPAATEAPAETRTPFEIANSMVGSSVDSLYAAIGQPGSSNYSESCLTENGQDGWLYYDGFTVTTIKYDNGSEIVMAVY